MIHASAIASRPTFNRVVQLNKTESANAPNVIAPKLIVFLLL
jgi:hypothetical protein